MSFRNATATARPKISTVLQQTKDLQAVVSRFANTLGNQGLTLTNITVKAKVGRSLSALVNAWGLLEESRLRLTKKANPIWDAHRANSESPDDPPCAPSEPAHLEPSVEPSKESLSRPTVPAPPTGEG